MLKKPASEPPYSKPGTPSPDAPKRPLMGGKGHNAFAKRIGACGLALLVCAPLMASAQMVPSGRTVTDEAMAIVCTDSPVSMNLVPCLANTQGTTLNNAQSTSAANTAQTITLTGTSGKRWTLRQVYGACSAGTTTAVTIADGGTTILSVPGLSTTIAALVPSPPGTGITISTGNNLVVTIPTCGVSNTSTVSVIADQS